MLCSRNTDVSLFFFCVTGFSLSVCPTAEQSAALIKTAELLSLGASCARKEVLK